MVFNEIENENIYSGNQDKSVIDIEGNIDKDYVNFNIKDNGFGFESKMLDRR